MNYTRVGWLADQVDKAGTTLSDSRRKLADTDPLTAAAFGNLANSASCHTAFSQLVTKAGTITDYLATTLGADADRIRKVISIFQRTDAESADELCAAAGNSLNIYTTHVHSEGGQDGDVERARQINMAGNHMARQPGDTIFTGDMNATIDDRNQSGDALRHIRDQYGYRDAGVNAGPTHGGHRRIDYVFTGPELGTGNTRVVDGGTSDHDAIVTDVTVPHGW